MNKFMITIPLLFCLVSTVGCNKAEKYDKGYEAAWEEEEEPSVWASKEEKEGYQDGIEDVETYEDGYADGYDKAKPELLDDDLYMDGYKEGKADQA